MEDFDCTVKVRGLFAKKTAHAGLGLFASECFDPGELLWTEFPFLETVQTLEKKENDICENQSAIFRNQIVYMRSFVTSDTEAQHKLLKRAVPDREMSEQSYLWKYIQSASTAAAKILYPDHSEDTLRKICLIFMANQYPSSADRGAIYEVGSLFNHHCAANATYTYDKSTGRGKWFALRPISPGDEVCVSYVYPHYPTFWRQDQLRHRYLFNCSCSKCNETDLNRMILCSLCHPQQKENTDLSDLKTIQKGFFTKSMHSGALDSWVCDSCKNERVSNGVPILLEKQLCVDVQMMMSKWAVHDILAIIHLRDMTLRLLGPKHFCYIYSLQCMCNSMMQGGSENFEQLVLMAKTIVKWIEEREPGFSGFHLKPLLLKIILWCSGNRVQAEACAEFISIVEPWILWFGSKWDVEEIMALKSKVCRAQGASISATT